MALCLQKQLESFAHVAESSSDEINEAFLRALLVAGGEQLQNQLIDLVCEPHLHQLVWHGLALAPLSDQQLQFSVVKVFQSLLEASNSQRLVSAAARLVAKSGLECIMQQLIALVKPSAEDEEAWTDNDSEVQKLDCVLMLLQKLLAIGACDAPLCKDLLPVLLSVLKDQEASDVRKAKILGMLHMFYAQVHDDQSVLDLWAAVGHSDPDLALALMCRMCAHLNKARRFGVLLGLSSFWSFVYQRMEENGLRKNIPLALSKQAMFLLRESVEACSKEKVVVSAEPFMSWTLKSSVRDWNSFLTLFELLEQYSIHLIEPVWPTFDQIAASGSVGSIWLQLLVRRGLTHDSVHVTRLILVFLFQSKRESLQWLSPSFFAGPLLSSLMLPVLYRGVSGMVYPGLVYAFWRRIFDDPSQKQALVEAMVPELFPSNPKFHHNVYAVPVLLEIMTASKQKCISNVRQVGKVLLLGRSHYW
jgi:hypothetical protein